MSSKYEFYREASLSQKLAHRYPEYTEYAGTEPKISITLAILNVMGRHGIIDLNDPAIRLLKDILNEQRKAMFATSERVDQITKMGLQMPRAEDEFFGGGIDEDRQETDIG